jgi:hypothetical protein
MTALVEPYVVIAAKLNGTRMNHLGGRYVYEEYEHLFQCNVGSLLRIFNNYER